jgi:isopenicillin N synthase-like dioxygenase
LCGSARFCRNRFFYALNHRVSVGLIENAFIAARRFFALLMEQKMALKLNQNHNGYLPIGTSVQAAIGRFSRYPWLAQKSGANDCFHLVAGPRRSPAAANG